MGGPKRFLPPFLFPKQTVYLLRRLANLNLREVAEMAGVTIGRVAQIQSEIESLPKDERLERIVARL